MFFTSVMNIWENFTKIYFKYNYKNRYNLKQLVCTSVSAIREKQI